MNFLGIVIPFPNSLFIPISPSAEAAPVANTGATLKLLLLRKEVVLHPAMREM